ncbi:MAG: TlpA family protein disulfide reductase [Bryobacteraceae bacterium]|nr:TlpA family protein disulfide reductase [Bryobacteraceae bacterium]
MPVLRMLALLAALESPPSGLWDAAVEVEGRRVDFRMELEFSGEKARGAILDGERRNWSTSGSFRNGRLELVWDYFDSRLEAEWKEGALQGAYQRRTRAGLVRRTFTAKPFQPEVSGGEENIPQVAGAWRIQTGAARGVRVMNGYFAQSGAVVTGTIQRLDGDFGTLSGRVNGRRLRLSHFDGVRATLVEAEIQPDGTLKGVIDGKTEFTAARAEEAARLGLPEPPDPSRYTSVKNPLEPLEFEAVDLDGRPVRSSDARFRGKALIVTLMGSWCPNCHDEAELLADLYRRYRGQGLEIVALGFEYTGESERDRSQLRAFARRHGIEYTMLYAGTTNEGEVQRVLPQLVNFASYPTTLFLDRNHRVRSVHTGFAGPANQAEHARLREEFERLVREILAAH